MLKKFFNVAGPCHPSEHYMLEKQLPTGIQSFETIRTQNGVYVDKTAHIYNLIKGIKKQFFLSRPRRFGKTLLCSTLTALFQGKRELFEGLAIDKTDWQWESHPVIRLDMSQGDFDEGFAALEDAINTQLMTSAFRLYLATLTTRAFALSSLWGGLMKR